MLKTLPKNAVVFIDRENGDPENLIVSNRIAPDKGGVDTAPPWLNGSWAVRLTALVADRMVDPDLIGSSEYYYTSANRMAWVDKNGVVMRVIVPWPETWDYLQGMKKEWLDGKSLPPKGENQPLPPDVLLVTLWDIDPLIIFDALSQYALTLSNQYNMLRNSLDDLSKGGANWTQAEKKLLSKQSGV